jgi:hypothetical protein
MDINSDIEDSNEKVEIKRTGCNVTWIFKNTNDESVEFDMSSIRANTITALLKRGFNLGHSSEMKPRVLQGTQTEVQIYSDHCAIEFDQNPQLRLVRNSDQVVALIRDLEEAA